MPMSRGYGSYSTGGYSSFPSASSHIYTSTFTTYRAPNYGRAATPTVEDLKSKQYGISPVGAPATYKYMSRNEYYSPTQDFRAPVRTINTDDIDVTKDKNLERDYAIPGEIKRDTAANIAGGQKVIRLVTMRQKTNPYALGAHGQGDGLTLGQRLAMKHWIEPKPKKKSPSPPPKRRISYTAPIREEPAADEDSDAESWTWETCSSSEEVGPDVKVFPSDSSRKTSEDSGSKERLPVAYAHSGRSATTELPPLPIDDYKTRRQSIERWTRAMFDKPADSKRPSTGSKASSNLSSTSQDRTKLTSLTSTTTTTRTPIAHPSVKQPEELQVPVRVEVMRSSLSTSSGSPESTPKFARPYQPPVPQFSSDEDSDLEGQTYNRGWRRGQPPRSDVVVKLMAKEPKSSHGRAKSGQSKNLYSSDTLVIKTQEHSKMANKILTSSAFMRETVSMPREELPRLQPDEKKVKNIVHEQQSSVAAVELVGQLKKDIDNMQTVEQIKSYMAKVDSQIKEALPEQQLRPQIDDPTVLLDKPTTALTKEIATQVVELALPEPVAVSLSPESAADFVEQRQELVGSVRELVQELVGQVPVLSREKQASLVKETTPPLQIDHPVDEHNDINVTAQEVAKAIDDMLNEVVAIEQIITKTQSLESHQSPVSKILGLGEGNEVQQKDGQGQSSGLAATTLHSSVLKTETLLHKEVKLSQLTTTPKRLNCPTQSISHSVSQLPEKVSIERIEIGGRSKALPPTLVKGIVPEKRIPTKPLKDGLLEKAVPTKLLKENVLAPEEITGLPPKYPEVKAKHLAQKKKIKKPPKKTKSLDAGVDDAVALSIIKNAITPELKTESQKLDENLRLIALPKSLVNSDSARSSVTSNASSDFMMPSQLERLPSPVRKLFEMKSRAAAGETYVPIEPKEKPKYWDNKPKETDPKMNPLRQMAQMRDESKQHQKKIREEQEAIIQSSASEAEEPWYKDESQEFQKQLETYEHRPSNHHKADDEKRTPDENMAIIKLYGGIQFPEIHLATTPKRILKKIFTQKRRKLSNSSSGACNVHCHKKCEKNMPNLCGIDHKLLAETLHALRKERNMTVLQSKQGGPDDGSGTTSPERRASGRNASQPSTIEESEESSDNEETSPPVSSPPRGTTAPMRNDPPVKSRPKFRKYGVDDFNFLKVLGKGSFGKVILAELRGAGSYYAVKCLKKDVVLEDDDIECTMIERKVLALGCKHPFLCHLFCTFQTNSHLFFVMEYLNGGDLMFHIQQSGRFEAERARFYSAEILLALKFLHRKGIVYRDLKLDNLLLDYAGHIRIADFGMCKLQIYLDKTADTFCGTPDYMAPEIIKGLHYTHCVDWWSFGVLLYEMLIGQSPFNGCDEDELFWSICNEQPYFPRFLSREAKHILQLLLEKDPSKRLGVSGCPAGGVTEQPFFRTIDFAKLERKEIVPPFKPKLRHSLDVSYFDEAFTQEVANLTPVDEDFLASVNQQQFKGFSYTNPNYTVK